MYIDIYFSNLLPGPTFVESRAFQISDSVRCPKEVKLRGEKQEVRIEHIYTAGQLKKKKRS